MPGVVPQLKLVFTNLSKLAVVQIDEFLPGDDI